MMKDTIKMFTNRIVNGGRIGSEADTQTGTGTQTGTEAGMIVLDMAVKNALREWMRMATPLRNTSQTGTGDEVTIGGGITAVRIDTDNDLGRVMSTNVRISSSSPRKVGWSIPSLDLGTYVPVVVTGLPRVGSSMPLPMVGMMVIVNDTSVPVIITAGMEATDVGKGARAPVIGSEGRVPSM